MLVALLVSALVAGCSSDGDSGSTPSIGSPESGTSQPAGSLPTDSPSTEPPSTEPPSSTPTSSAPPAASCAAPTDTTPVSATSLGDDRDFDVVSFDGTVIRAHWFPLPGLVDDATAPTVLMGPGWGSAGDTEVDAVGVLGAIDIASLRAAGYNVLTWDPRGFGESTGVVTIDSPDFEGRDVEQLIDWVATLPGVELDAERDPRLGMVGGSYGGGIQLVTAPDDCRIDALVPVIAWNSLTTSLYKNETPKTGWTDLLVTASFGAPLDPTIARAQAEATATGTFAAEDAAWLADRGPAERVAEITAPTLLIQGTVDTLFTLDEAIANYELLHDAGVPVSMLWFCGGHGVCLTDEGDSTRVGTAAIAWLDRWVRGDTSVETIEGFELIDQDGRSMSSAEFSTGTGGALTGTGTGTLDLVADGGSGPAVVDQSEGLLGTFIATITPSPATNALDVEISADEESVVVGSAELTLTYSGSAGTGDRPTRVFAQFVDPATGLVIGNQITPIEVVLDGASHTTTVSLEAIAHTVRPGSPITLQVVATTVAYTTPQFGGEITFDAVDVSLPVSDDLTVD